VQVAAGAKNAVHGVRDTLAEDAATLVRRVFAGLGLG
jgi:hypothetical protein